MSEIEKVAGDLRSLAAHTRGRGHEVAVAARTAGQLAELAQAQRSSGLNVARLVGQLHEAATRAGKAAHHMGLVGANGEAFADRLAAGGGGGATLNPFVAGAVGVGTVLAGATADLQAAASTTSSSDDRASAVVDRAATQHDNWEGANQLGGRSPNRKR